VIEELSLISTEVMSLEFWVNPTANHHSLLPSWNLSLMLPPPLFPLPVVCDGAAVGAAGACVGAAGACVGAAGAWVGATGADVGVDGDVDES